MTDSKELSCKPTSVCSSCRGYLGTRMLLSCSQTLNKYPDTSLVALGDFQGPSGRLWLGLEKRGEVYSKAMLGVSDAVSDFKLYAEQVIQSGKYLQIGWRSVHENTAPVTVNNSFFRR